jgi:hypothetical protein
MGVTWLTESPRDWRSSVATGFFVLLVVLLRIAAPPVVWIDATVKSGPIAERNRSEGRRPEHALGLAAIRRRSATGDARFPHGGRRRST